MAAYVRDQLITHPELIATRWPLEVHWDELSVTATLTRGELVIPSRWTRRSWWMPQRRSTAREIVDSLARVLIAKHRMYASADETGRIRRGDLVLEPGVREEGGGASPYGRYRYSRIGEDMALPLEMAVEVCWIHVKAER